MPCKSHTPRRFDNYEISGCREFTEENGGSYFEPAEDHEATVWTLYGHTEGEGVMAIGDFKTRKIAEDVYFRIVGKRFTATYEADAVLRVRHAADQMLAALKVAIPYVEDLASSSHNKRERRAAKLMRKAIARAEEK
jgi:hypothetical protein